MPVVAPHAPGRPPCVRVTTAQGRTTPASLPPVRAQCTTGSTCKCTRRLGVLPCRPIPDDALFTAVLSPGNGKKKGAEAAGRRRDPPRSPALRATPLPLAPVRRRGVCVTTTSSASAPRADGRAAASLAHRLGLHLHARSRGPSPPRTAAAAGRAARGARARGAGHQRPGRRCAPLSELGGEEATEPAPERPRVAGRARRRRSRAAAWLD